MSCDKGPGSEADMSRKPMDATMQYKEEHVQAVVKIQAVARGNNARKEFNAEKYATIKNDAMDEVNADNKLIKNGSYQNPNVTNQIKNLPKFVYD